MPLSKYLIVGNAPFLSKSIIIEAAEDSCIVALDGASNKLANLGIKPDIILGDFDSLDEKTMRLWGINQAISEPYMGKCGVSIVPAKNQNFTDFQKAIFFAMRQANKYGFLNATSIHAVCITGGRADHEQTNILALKQYHSPHCPIYLHNECQSIQFVSNQTVHIQGRHNDYCGLFGMPDAKMSVKNSGLAYGNETLYSLSFAQFSSSNRLTGDNGAIVEIQGEALIIHPPMLNAQRLFSEMTREKQLLSLLKDEQCITSKMSDF